ncbi:MAG: DUF4956 domain-containing protein [Proteobacteria bacterium]|nr:DUF4956 domain-containing protein [Pseudomonadota bacterium]
MNKIESFEQFLATQSVQLPLVNFCFNLLLAAALGYVVGRVYVKYGYSISNRKSFSRNLLLIAMTTMVVISIVKSSLALSLGLVGALSIVRFRTAIKEPEELAYLFIAITIGLGLGADQFVPTVIAVLLITAVIVIARSRDQSSSSESNLYITISSNNSKAVSLENITEIIKPSCVELSLKRFDQSGSGIEVVFHALFNDISNFSTAKAGLLNLSDDVTVSLIDQQGIVR